MLKDHRFYLRWFCFLAAFSLVLAQPAFAQELAPAEKKYLEEKGAITFVSQSVYPPFEFLNNDGEHTGMSIELARWISTEYGFKTRFIDTSFKKAQEWLLNSRADVLTSFFYSDKRDLSYDFTDTMFEVPATIFIAADRPDMKGIIDLNGKRIAMQRGDYAKEFLESRSIVFTTVPTANFAEAADYVIAGKADALIGDEQIVLYHVYSNNLGSKIKKVGKPLYIGQNCMAVREDNALLLGILQKGIAKAKQQGVLEVIHRKWLGTTIDLSRPFWDKYKAFILASFAALLFLTFLVWSWNTKLRREVTKRTKELSESRQTLQTILAALPVGVALLKGRKISWVNKSMLAMLGYEEKQLLNQSARLLYIDGTSFQHDGRLIAEMQEKSTYKPLETTWQRRDGTTFDCLLRYAQVRDTEDEKLEIAIAEDISERKLAERRLRHAKEEWEQTFDTVPDMIMVLDDKHRIQRMNRAQAELFNLSFADFSSADPLYCFDVFHGTSAPPATCPHTLLLQDGREHTEEIYEDSLKRYFNLSVTPLHDSSGRLLGSVHVARDITERKLHEHRVEQLSTMRRNLIDTVDLPKKIKCIAEAIDGLFEHYFIRFWLLHSPALDLFTDHITPIPNSTPLRIDEHEFHLVTETDQLVAQERINYLSSRERNYIQKLATTSRDSVTHAVQHQGNEIHNHFYFGKSIRGADNQFCGVLSLFSLEPISSIEQDLFENISETASQVLRAEMNAKALQKSEQRFRHLFESLIDVYFNTNADGMVVLVSPSVETVLGYTPDQMIGHPSTDYYADPADREKLLEGIRRDGELRNNEILMKRSDGTRIWVSFNAKPLWDNNGNYTGIEGLFRDVTQNKQAEELMRIQRDLATNLTDIAELGPALDICLEATLKVEEADCCGIYLYDADGEDLVLMAHRHIPPGFLPTVTRLKKDTHETRLVATGEPIYCHHEDLLESWNINDGEKQRTLTFGLRGFGCLPISQEGHVIGCLTVASKSADSFSDFSRYSLESIAVLTAGGITKSKAEQAVMTSQRNLQTLFRSLDDFLFILDSSGHIVSTNPSVEKHLGYSAKELKGMEFVLVHPSHQRQEAETILQDMAEGYVNAYEIPLLTRDGRHIEVETKLNMGSWNDQPALFGISRDISKRLEAEEARRISEERLATAIDAIDEGFVIFDANDRLVMCNTKYRDIYKKTRDLMVPGIPFEDIIRAGAERGQHADITTTIDDWVAERLRLHQQCTDSIEQKLDDGRWIRVSERKMKDGSIVGFRVDITGVKEAGELARKALQEKEVLLREIHHRVKNNMQVVSSLLSLQASKIEDNAVQAVFADAQARVQSMALVHETLYRSDDLSRIHFQDYLERLSDQIKHLFSYQGMSVSILTGNTDVVLSVEQAAVCGLILVEILTNSFKYAFPGQDKGTIRIDAAMASNNEVALCVGDDGIGVNKDFAPENGTTLGLRMVIELVEDQLEGTWRFDGRDGTRWDIRWPVDIEESTKGEWNGTA